MVKLIKLSIIAVISVLLASCAVPNATSYYRPTVDVKSSHIKGHCVPLERYVLFEINVKGKVYKFRGYGNTYSHKWGEGTEVQLIVDGNWNEIKYKNNEFYLIPKGGSKKIQPTKIYGEQNQHKDELSYNSGAVFPKVEEDAFDAYFPPLIIDGEEIELPVLHIKKTIWVGISPFNC